MTIQGMVAGIIGTLVDITRLKESERHQRDRLCSRPSGALASAISHRIATVRAAG